MACQRAVEIRTHAGNLLRRRLADIVRPTRSITNAPEVYPFGFPRGVRLRVSHDPVGEVTFEIGISIVKGAKQMKEFYITASSLFIVLLNLVHVFIQFCVTSLSQHITMERIESVFLIS